MGISVVQSPWSTSGNSSRNAERGPGVSPLSSPRRADQIGEMGGHLGRHSGGKGWTPEPLRPASSIVVGQPRDPCDPRP
jgi:hypothetical protein